MKLAYIRWASLVLFLLAVVTGFHWQPMPQPQAVNAKDNVFSAQRAIKHVVELGQSPRPMGSTGHVRARTYLINTIKALGYEPEIQNQPYLENDYPHRIYAQVNNILVRVPGGGPSDQGAILFAAHYDSEFNTPAAGDNGSAVAAMLETLRVLKTETAFKRDLIFLFTDGEEMGQVGAQAFAEYHPWSTDVSLVLNFDGRGNRGPVLLFETSAGNSALIREAVAKGVQLNGSSLSYAVYRLLDNTTDFGHFMKINAVQGLNFAHIHGPAHYHNMTDQPEDLSLATLQNQGELMLGLARALGNSDVAEPAATDEIFFVLPVLGFLSYPGSWSVSLFSLVAILFIAAVVRGKRLQTLGLLGLVGGFFWLLLTALVTAALSLGLWIVFQIGTENTSGHGFGDSWFLYGWLFLGIFAVGSSFALFSKRLSPQSVCLSAALLWLVFAGMTALKLPGASYLFLWPLAFVLVGFHLSCHRAEGERDKGKQALIWSVCALIGTLFIAVAIQLLFTAFRLDRAPIIVFLIVMALGLWLGPYLTLRGETRMRVPLLALALGILCCVVPGLGRPSPDKPAFTSLIYTLNADNGEAKWLSTFGLDDWNQQHLKGDVVYEQAPMFFPNSSAQFHQSPAQTIALDAPELEVLSLEEDDLQRIVRLRIRSPRGGHFKIAADEGYEFYSASIEDQFIGNTFKSIRVLGVPETGVTLLLACPKDSPTRLRVMNWLNGLPDFAKPLTPSYVPTTDFVMYQFSTMVSKSFDLTKEVPTTTESD